MICIGHLRGGFRNGQGWEFPSATVLIRFLEGARRCLLVGGSKPRQEVEKGIKKMAQESTGIVWFCR